MTIAFDATDANRIEIVRTLVKSRQLKPSDPHKEPPVITPLNRNPRKHRVVAWRHDAKGLDNTIHETKEAALDFARSLSWAIYYQYAVMDGRDAVEKRSIAIPEGYAIDNRCNPVRLDWAN